MTVLQRVPLWIADSALVGLLTGTALLTGVAVGDSPGPHWRAIGLVLLGPQTLPLLARRRWPGAVLAILASAMGVRVWLGMSVTVAALGVLVAIYSVGVYGNARTRLLAWAVTVAAFAAGLLAFVLSSRPYRLFAIFLPAGAFLVALLVGDHLRTRRAYTAALEERAARLERDRQHQAAAAAAAERARIARELHDLVAHHVSAIAVQAQAARYATDPTQVTKSLGDIQQASDQVLIELRQLLGLLRDEPAALAPQPGLAQIDELIGAARAAGLSVELRRAGTTRPLPQPVDLSTYRIVQEALTNVRKHANAQRVRVSITDSDERIEICVVDDGVGPAADSTVGRGLLGMKERVALFGGSFQAGPAPGGGYRVHAVLPIGEAGCRSVS
jgi:signal transduction histidine kinase